jgi:hypothetical protein
MATDAPRRKSPRAPAIPLDEALDRALKVYDKEHLHPAPADVVAQHMGYKDANNGRALTTLAAIRYYGLVERPQDGLLAVTKDVEAYKYAPDEALRRSYLRRFLSAPQLFADLLDKYAAGLPSDGTLKYDLIQRGFLPATAETMVNVFKRSAEFARAFSDDAPDQSTAGGGASNAAVSLSEPDEVVLPDPPQAPSSATKAAVVSLRTADAQPPTQDDFVGHDRIPVRLSGGRRAWLVIPAAFYAADKARLKAQIDLLLTEEDDDAE